ncbi:hypothetical protein BaRGS_00027552, partial [Batillaria attramentaria]
TVPGYQVSAMSSGSERGWLTVTGHSTRLVLWTVFGFSVLRAALAFNVDTNKPIIYKGPSGSYFGYSVAMLENRKGGW